MNVLLLFQKKNSLLHHFYQKSIILVFLHRNYGNTAIYCQNIYIRSLKQQIFFTCSQSRCLRLKRFFLLMLPIFTISTIIYRGKNAKKRSLFFSLIKNNLSPSGAMFFPSPYSERRTCTYKGIVTRQTPAVLSRRFAPGQRQLNLLVSPHCFFLSFR